LCGGIVGGIVDRLAVPRSSAAVPLPGAKGADAFRRRSAPLSTIVTRKRYVELVVTYPLEES
jgi:hypothetical protein